MKQFNENEMKFKCISCNSTILHTEMLPFCYISGATNLYNVCAQYHNEISYWIGKSQNMKLKQIILLLNDVRIWSTKKVLGA